MFRTWPFPAAQLWSAELSGPDQFLAVPVVPVVSAAADAPAVQTPGSALQTLRLTAHSAKL